jgi:HK97 gp10 family phage protein
VNLDAALAAALRGSEKGALAALDIIGAAVAEAASELAPEDTGALAESITHEVGTDEHGPYADVIADEPYAIYVEFGTLRQAPEPFMQPAAEDGARSMQGVVADEIARAQREALEGLPRVIEF